MTNKPMLSVERELIQRVISQALGMSAKKDRAYAAHELRALLDKPYAQHQGEPVAVMYEDGTVLTKAECGNNFYICCKVETPLYTEQPAPVAVVMPERETYTKYLVGVIPHNANEVNAYKDGWNTCLEEVARLNGANP